MKRYIIRFIIISLPIILGLIVVEILVRNIPNTYQTKNDYIIKHQNQIETLILGSSHLFMGLAPEYLDENAFSLANVSQTLDIDYLLLENYIDKLNNLQKVVLPISYFSFYIDTENGPEAFRLRYYNLYMGLPVGSLISNVELDDCKTATDKIFQYYIKHNDLVSMTEQGQSKSYFLEGKPKHDNWENAANRAKNHTYTTPPLQKEIDALYKIADLCKEHNIELILVSTPVRKNYYEKINPAQKEEIEDIMTNFLSHNPYAKYYDFMQDSEFIHTDDYFYDADHLTNVGADAFSVKLKSIISPTSTKEKSE